MRSTRRITSSLVIGLAAAAAHAVTVTEVNYHPRAADGETEFIELYHEGSVPLDIGGFAFTAGVRYIFPAGAVIAPGQYAVIARDPARIQEVYGVAAFGPYEGQLDNDGDRLTLCREGGGTVVSFRYDDGAPWPEQADGFGHTLSLRHHALDPAEASSWAASPLIGGTPGKPNGFASEAIDTDLVPPGATWRYWEGVTAPDPRWRERTFDDGAWPAGPSGFGYGDGDDATVLVMQNVYAAVFIRTPFTLAAPLPDKLILRVSYDDGFAAWIDGIPVARANLGADPIAFDALAAASHEAAGFEEFDATAVMAAAGPGTHVLAVEGHNLALASTDFSLHPALAAREIMGGAAAGGLRINEVLPGGFIELHNAGAEAIDLSGAAIGAGRDATAVYTFPPSTQVAPGGYRVVQAAELPFALQPAGGELVLFVIDAARRRVLDAHTAGAPSADAFGRFPDGADAWRRLAAPTPGETNDAGTFAPVAINEIMYHPIGDRDPFDPAAPDPEDLEYIELFNHGTRPVDLGGWRIADGVGYTFPEGAVIEGGAYLVLARNPARFAAVYGTAPAFGPYDGALANEGERLALADARGNTVDEVRYHDGGRWPEWADGGGSSLERIDPRAPGDAPSAWQASDETARAPWTEVRYASARFGLESEMQLWLLGKGACVLDDFHVTSGGVEYVADGDLESGRERYVFKGTHADSFFTTEEAASGQYALQVEASGRGEQRWNHIEFDTTRPLVNGLTYTVSYRARWLRGMPSILARQHGHGLARTVRLAVPEDLGTPGRRNSRCLDNAGPVLDGMTQAPACPLPADAVTIRIRARDPDGVAAVRLFYRNQSAPAFSQAAMHDDGAHGDGGAGDGIWAGAIPPFAAGTRVQFAIEAEDARGAIASFPDAEPCLYMVPSAWPRTAVAQGHLIMTDAAAQELASRFLMSNELLPASFVLNDDTIYHNVMFRPRGSPYIRPQQPPGFRVRFGNDNPFRGRSKALNLDPQMQDASKQRERTVFHLARKIGVSRADGRMPYSLDDYLTLWRNGARLALYEQVERVDGAYLSAWWPGDDDGCLLKVNVQTEFRDDGGFDLKLLATLEYRGEDEEYYRLLFNMFSHEELDDFAPLIDLCRTINQQTGTALENAVLDRARMRQWADEFAVRLYVADWDTFAVVNGHNIYMYLPAVARRWEIIPWDADLTFGDANSITDIGVQFPATRKVFARPQFARMLQAAHWRLAGDVAAPATIAPEVARVYAAIAAEGAAAPSEITNFLSARAPVVRSRLAITTPLRISTNNGLDFEAAAYTVAIAGTAPVSAAYITLNDESVDERLVWTAVTAWRLDVALGPGANRLNFKAWDHDGALLGEAAITVTAPRPPLFIERIEPVEGPAAGGTPVRVYGTGFEPGAFLLFMGQPARQVDVAASTEISGVSPPSPIGPSPADIAVVNPDGASFIVADGFTYLPGAAFVRGDPNDDGATDIADAIYILGYLFARGPLGCADAADVNDDGKLDVSDAIALLAYLYASGTPPPPPFPAPGMDPTGDALDCAR